MAAGVSRMSRSSVRPCYTTESLCWAQEAVLLHRIFSVTGPSRRLSPTPFMHPESQPSFVHFRNFVTDMVYVALLAPDEKSKHFKRRMYNVLHMLAMNGSPTTEMRIVREFPHTAWNQAWKNLHASPVSEEIKCTWYKALHDLIPTNDRLAAINLTDKSACSSCGHPHSLQHKIKECQDGPVIWTWTKKLLAYLLRDQYVASACIE